MKIRLAVSRYMKWAQGPFILSKKLRCRLKGEEFVLEAEPPRIKLWSEINPE